ncbi:type IV pilin protein [Magnetococcales bacterium HHB-1]
MADQTPHTTPKKDAEGFTLIEIMVVLAIIAIMASLALPRLKTYMISSHLEEAKPYLLQIASKEQLYYTRYGSYYTSSDEQDLEDNLGVNLRDASNFCFLVRSGNGTYISSSGDSAAEFEVWAVLLNTGGANVTTTVASSSVTCTTADSKNDPTGWVDTDTGNIGSTGRVVVLRYPPPDNDIDTTNRDGRTAVYLSWSNGISFTDALQ